MRRVVFVAGLALVTLTLCFSATRAQWSFTEDFTTTTYKDAVNTTANWDTTSGELRLFPFSMASVGSFDTPGNAFDVAVSGDLAFVADDPDVVILDIEDPENPIVLSTFAAGNARSVHVQGDLLYVAGIHPNQEDGDGQVIWRGNPAVGKVGS